MSGNVDLDADYIDALNKFIKARDEQLNAQDRAMSLPYNQRSHHMELPNENVLIQRHRAEVAWQAIVDVKQATKSAVEDTYVMTMDSA